MLGLIVSGVRYSSTRRLGNFRCIWEYVAVLTGRTRGLYCNIKGQWGDPKIVMVLEEICNFLW